MIKFLLIFLFTFGTMTPDYGNWIARQNHHKPKSPNRAGGHHGNSHNLWESSNGRSAVTITVNDPRQMPLPLQDYYQPPPTFSNSFNPHLINTSFKPGLFTSSNKLGRASYFQKEFRGLNSTQIFHKVNCYQYLGFQNLVESLPGFEDFILNLESKGQLEGQSDIDELLAYRVGRPGAGKAFSYLRNKAKQVHTRKAEQEFNRQNELLFNAGFNQAGINLIRSRGIDHEFIYGCNNAQQIQRSLITDHFNELAAFANQENHITYPLKDITQKSETFAIAANTANRNNKQQQSDALIEVAKGFLSLAKGFTDACGRTGIAIASAIEHPINTFYEVNDAICQISHGIAKVANTWGKFQAATDLMDLEMLNEANSEIEYACSCGRQIYEMVKHKYNTSSRAEILEMTGGLIANAVIAGYAMPQMQAAILQEVGTTIKLGKAAILSKCNLNKLGNINKKIKHVTGLLCRKGTDYFAKSANFTEELEFVLASEIGNIKVPAGNLLKHEAQIAPSSKQIIDVARTAKIATFENQISKLVPKYSKQILHDAKQALRVSEYKILKKDNLAKEIEDLCVKIKKIVESKPHRKNFIYDAAQGSKVTVGSVEEALIACAAEDAGIVKKLYRASETSYDFYDKKGNKWDVKSLYIDTFKTEYQIKKFVSKIKENILNGESILLNTTNIKSDQLSKLEPILNNLISKKDLEKIKIINLQ